MSDWTIYSWLRAEGLISAKQSAALVRDVSDNRAEAVHAMYAANALRNTTAASFSGEYLAARDAWHATQRAWLEAAVAGYDD